MRHGPTALPDGESSSTFEQESAETAIYEKYSDRVYFLALGELRSREDAEDVRAETFLRVFLALRKGKLRKPESLASFIVGITLNVIREHTRQKLHTRTTDDSEIELRDERSLESAFIDEEVNRSVEETVRLLKPREREFLRMYYYEEMPKEEIARALGIKQERLRLIKSRALKRFKEIYKKFTGS